MWFSPFKEDAEQLKTLQGNKQENSAANEEMSVPMVTKSALLLLDPNDLTEGEWVQVYHKGKKFLRKVVSVAGNGQVKVSCLEKPFGVREAI